MVKLSYKLIVCLIFACSIARGQVLTPIKEETRFFTKAKVSKEFSKMLDDVVFPHLPESSYAKKCGTWSVGNGYPVLQLECNEESDSVVSIRCIVWNDFVNTEDAVCFVRNGYLCALWNRYRKEWIDGETTCYQYTPYRSTALVDLLTTVDCPDFVLEVKYNISSNTAYLDWMSDSANYGKLQFHKHNVNRKKVFQFEQLDNAEDIRKCCKDFMEIDIKTYDFHVRRDVFAGAYLMIEFICEKNGCIKNPDMIYIHERNCTPCLTEKNKDALKAFLMEKKNWTPGMINGKNKRTLYSMTLCLRFLHGKVYYDF